MGDSSVATVLLGVLAQKREDAKVSVPETTRGYSSD